jgi:hypothetical protein
MLTHVAILLDIHIVIIMMMDIGLDLVEWPQREGERVL